MLLSMKCRCLLFNSLNRRHPLVPVQCPLNVSIMCFLCKTTYKQYRSLLKSIWVSFIRVCTLIVSYHTQISRPDYGQTYTPTVWYCVIWKMLYSFFTDYICTKAWYLPRAETNEIFNTFWPNWIALSICKWPSDPWTIGFRSSI